MTEITEERLMGLRDWLLSCQFESAHRINLKNKDAQA